MKIVLTILLLSGYIWSQNIYQYKQEQKNKKMGISLKKISTQNNSLTIIFYKDFDYNIINKTYPIKLKKCIIKRICIFDILDSSIDIKSLIKVIRNENRDIKHIQQFRKYYLKQF